MGIAVGDFDRDLKPAPFPSGSHILSSYIYSRYGVGNCEKGLGVGPNGQTYINFMYGWNKYFIAGFGGDGKPLAGNYLKGKIPAKTEGGNKQAEGLDSAVIGPVPASCGGIRVDLDARDILGDADHRASFHQHRRRMRFLQRMRTGHRDCHVATQSRRQVLDQVDGRQVQCMNHDRSIVAQRINPRL